MVRYYARGVALESSPEHPQPLRVIAHAVRGWVERLGAVWVEAQLIEINRRSGTRTIFLTLRDKFGKLDGLKVAIVGDVLHSRVARSNIWGLTRLGAEVGVCGPHTLLPRGIESLGVTVLPRVEDAIQWADALNVLRLQLERMTAGFIPSLREYNRVFGISSERLRKAPKDLVILHPGPMNRGVEIDSDVADGEHSVILPQVTNGVAVRMAVLYLLAGGRPGPHQADGGEK